MKRFYLTFILFLFLLGQIGCDQPLIDPNRKNLVQGTINGEPWTYEIVPYAYLDLNPDLINLSFHNCLSFQSPLYHDQLRIYDLPLESLGDTLALNANVSEAYASCSYIILDYDAIIYSSTVVSGENNWLFIQQDDEGNFTGSFSATLVAQNPEPGIPDTLQFEVSEFRLAYPTEN